MDAMDDAEVTPAADVSSRKRIPAACEACRVTKIRCQPSEQPGVCRKCLASKRECVLRSVPRVRRSKKARLEQESSPAESSPRPPGGPSRTFSINFDMASSSEVDENFETLRDVHTTALDSIFPEEPLPDFLAMSSLQSPPASSVPSQSNSNSHSIQDLHAKPSFNLASAESLLASFHPMLSQFPCIALSPDVTVSHLAAAQPFVLLSILAAASGSRTLQGHSLYDEEFRKVLGLKFVAGGERSIQLIQGILIYCAWYPFHLRPKNKQSHHYMRMAEELLHDLELDTGTECQGDALTPDSQVTNHQLDGIRAYLGFYYAVSSFYVSWQRNSKVNVDFTDWTSTCCDILERNAQVEGDAVLPLLARLASVVNEARAVIHGGTAHITEQQCQLVLLGLESQLRDLEARMSPQMASTPTIKLQTIFTRLYLQAGSLLKIPRPPRHLSPQDRRSLPPVASKLYASIATLQEFLSYQLSLDEATIGNFASTDWTRFILVVILAIRLSFATPECPEFDAGLSRSEIRLDEFLDKMCEQHESHLAPASKRVDVLSAQRAILGIVREKYQRRLLVLEHAEAMSAQKLSLGCPMLDGSMDQQIRSWESAWELDFASATAAAAATASASASTAAPASAQAAAAAGNNMQPVFHDLWATMTMGWARDESTSDS